MGIYIGLFEFDGPGLEPCDLLDESGVYAILHCSEDNYELIEIGQNWSIYEWGRTLKFKELQASYPGQMSLAVYYTYADATEDARKCIVEAIEQEFDNEPRLQLA